MAGITGERETLFTESSLGIDVALSPFSRKVFLCRIGGQRNCLLSCLAVFVELTRTPATMASTSSSPLVTLNGSGLLGIKQLFLNTV